MRRIHRISKSESEIRASLSATSPKYCCVRGWSRGKCIDRLCNLFFLLITARMSSVSQGETVLDFLLGRLAFKGACLFSVDIKAVEKLS